MRHPLSANSRRATLAAAVVALGSLFPAVAAAGAPLTKAEYQALLKQADARVGKVIEATDRGLVRKQPRAKMRALLLAWARVETELGTAFKSTQPPAEVAAANKLLSRGEILFGKQITVAANNLPSRVSAIEPHLERTLGNASGARMIDKALHQLHKAGYRASK